MYSSDNFMTTLWQLYDDRVVRLQLCDNYNPVITLWQFCDNSVTNCWQVSSQLIFCVFKAFFSLGINDCYFIMKINSTKRGLCENDSCFCFCFGPNMVSLKPRAWNKSSLKTKEKVGHWFYTTLINHPSVVCEVHSVCLAFFIFYLIILQLFVKFVLYL